MRGHSIAMRGVLPLLALLLLSVAARPAEAAPVKIQATLILASNEPAAQDQRLDAVEYKLRRIFGFEYYRHYGEQSGIVNVPGATTLNLGSGYRLELRVSDAKEGVRTAVQWFRGDEVVLNTTVRMQRRVPVILGGISHGGGTLIVTLVAE